MSSKNNKKEKYEKEGESHEAERHNAATDFKLGNLVYIKRIQFFPLSKHKSKYIGPYCIVDKSGPNQYEVWKMDFGDGPAQASTTAKFMKKWERNQTLDESSDDENPVSDINSDV